MITLTINGQSVSVPAGTTVLEAAKEIGVEIPKLCHLKDSNEIGACRICVVEVEGRRNLPASCVLPAEEGMVVKTHTKRVLEARQMNVQMMLSAHPQDCLQCVRSQNCGLQNLSQELGVRDVETVNYEEAVIDEGAVIYRDVNKCILCRRCVAVCEEVQGMTILGALGRGIDTVISPAWHQSLDQVSCTFCGQCVQVCPVGALYERNDVNQVWDMLSSDAHVVVQVAPAVRTALGEEFGLPAGTDVTGKMVTALRRLGFNHVFDTNFTADVTIMEEGHELLERIKTNDLPLLTSCSPGWIRFVEEHYPSLTKYLSTCKSPQQMFGALAKTYLAQVEGIDPASIKTVSIMPCTAKKYEAARPEMNDSGYQDVDVVLTTRELALLMKQAGLQLAKLKDEEFDAPMGMSSGGAVLFGQSGGVMEAALRTLLAAYPDRVKLEESDAGSKVFVDGSEVKVKVVSGLKQARRVLDDIAAGKMPAHFVEIMACPGGCVNGGGQPTVIDQQQRQEIIKKRRISLKDLDKTAVIAGSHENLAVQRLYETFLQHPLSEVSHHLLHTNYKGPEQGATNAEPLPESETSKH